MEEGVSGRLEMLDRIREVKMRGDMCEVRIWERERRGLGF